MNAGGMVHQNQCKLNPDRVSYQLGRTAWNKGKTSDSDPRISALSAKVSIAMRGKKPGNWNPNRDKLSQYRTDCTFKFSVYNYPKEFNLSLIEESGWYKAKNRGDNLYGISRDHMISVKYGWENNIDPKIISHPANCKLMIHGDNVRKYSNNSISLEELLYKIEQWNSKYGDVS
jgi:hypothetical protein